ncbi:MAG: hypothetical protein NUV32_07505 [Exilispira sp.]|jgi:thiamine pyrophosphokinase|nr:hypothetical protein [Exilispira sp.]
MKTVLYILSSGFENKKKFENLYNQADYIIAVDGGLLIAKENNLIDKIFFAVGDFDTCQNPEKIISEDKIFRFPVKKDLTDSILAYKLFNENIKKNQEMEFKHIFFSVSGPRQDHFLSLIFYFTWLFNQTKIDKNFIFKRKKTEFFTDLLNIEFHNDVESMFLLKAGKYKIYEQNDKIFSFFPLTKIYNLTLNPVEYPFPKKLEKFYYAGISNIFNDNIVELSFETGEAILFIENKDGNRIKIERLYKQF